MDTDTTTETMKEHATMESEGAPAPTTPKKSTETNGNVEQAVNDTFDTTAQKVGETYEKAKKFSNENPGKTIFIALGIGVGLGLLLSAGSTRSTTSRIAEPVVNALADIAKEFIR
jgi:ElaB/YqjD/DUF883 family membrane-anchored ribosome-binding protein